MLVKPSKKMLKILVAGDGGIGKTTFLKQFCDNKYVGNQSMTVGNNIFVKKVEVNSTPIFLQIWDFSGQERFRFMMESFARGGAGAILGFDVKRRKSYFNLKKWVRILRENIPNLPIVLIATKIDLGFHPTLNPNLAEECVSELHLLDFVETSSKEGMNIELPFRLLISQIEEIDDPEEINFLSMKM